MLTVIPAINCPLGDTDCVSAKLKIADGFAKWIHLDVADGKFTFNKTWGDLRQFPIFKAQFPNMQWEIHLMVEDPEAEVMAWLQTGVARIIVHGEVCDSAMVGRLSGEAKKRGAELMISLNPETPVDRFLGYAPALRAFQVLAVLPGFAGQKFLPLAVQKIEFLRAEMPDAILEVDGGINYETARLVKAAGANIIVAASAIFESADPGKAYNELIGI